MHPYFIRKTRAAQVKREISRFAERERGWKQRMDVQFIVVNNARAEVKMKGRRRTGGGEREREKLSEGRQRNANYTDARGVTHLSEHIFDIPPRFFAPYIYVALSVLPFHCAPAFYCFPRCYRYFSLSSCYLLPRTA